MFSVGVCPLEADDLSLAVLFTFQSEGQAGRKLFVPREEMTFGDCRVTGRSNDCFLEAIQCLLKILQSSPWSM